MEATDSERLDAAHRRIDNLREALILATQAMEALAKNVSLLDARLNEIEKVMSNPHNKWLVTSPHKRNLNGN